MNDAVSRILRTLVQLLAAGAFTALFDQIAGDVATPYAPYVMIFSTLLVTIAQNVTEKATGTMLFRPSSA
jgi:hypothetical protein